MGTLRGWRLPENGRGRLTGVLHGIGLWAIALVGIGLAIVTVARDQILGLWGVVVLVGLLLWSLGPPHTSPEREFRQSIKTATRLARELPMHFRASVELAATGIALATVRCADGCPAPDTWSVEANPAAVAALLAELVAHAEGNS
jgi:hypothetical protein